MMMVNLAMMWRPTALLALSASERWSAVKNLKPDTSVPVWLIVVTAVALTTLVVSALVIRYNQGPHKSAQRRR